MKQRLFFITLGAIGIGIGAFYAVDFFSQHSFVGRPLTLSFILLIALSVLLQLSAHFLRAYKSRYLLDNIRPTTPAPLFNGLAVGFLFNSLLPLRLGEIIRAIYTGDALAISKTTVFASIILERIVDGFILGLTFIGTGLLIRGESVAASEFIVAVGAGVIVVTTMLAVVMAIARSENHYLLKLVNGITGIFNEGIANRLRFMAWSGIYGTKLMLSRKASLRKYLLASLLMWALYFGAIASVTLAFFQSLDPAKIWYTIQSAYAGISAPAGPAYVGAFHQTVINALDKINLGGTSGFALGIWLIMIAPISLAGIYVLIKRRLTETQEISKNELLINKLYRDKDISAELGHFLGAYFKGEKINQILTQAELDGKFQLIKSFKGGSNAHTILVWQDGEMRVKKITLPQFADKLEAQAQWLIERQNQGHVPQVIQQDTTEHYYCFDLSYREDYFPFFEYIHSNSVSSSFGILKRVLNFMDKVIYRPVPAKHSRDNLKDYIETKVLGKVNDTASMSSSISQLLAHSKLVINGVKYDNILPVVDKIKKHKQAMADLTAYQETPIHGDLTIDNLIASAKGDFLVLDPNNENQVSAPVVDYGKLYQSLHSGYEFLIQLDQCQVDGNKVSFEEAKSQKYAGLYEQLDEKLKTELSPADYHSILFHEAVHYCRMLTYRVGINPDTVPLFYATAVKLFNEFLAQYE